jgi:hypothetical protein
MKPITFVLIALVLAVLFMGKGRLPSSTGDANTKWTIYGSMDCGWTRKQIDHMKEYGIKYKFVDCSKKKCDGVKGFPTTVHATGVRFEGYNEFFSNRE